MDREEEREEKKPVSSEHVNLKVRNLLASCEVLLAVTNNLGGRLCKSWNLQSWLMNMTQAVC